MLNKLRILLLILSVSALSGCKQDLGTNLFYQHPEYDFPYRLDRPERSWELPATLVEISGLSYTEDDRLACIQDEDGTIFIFDPEAGRVIKEIGFGDAGDYEGIEVIGKDAWVLKSNGNLYHVEDYQEQEATGVSVHKTPLSRKNDAEGLAYDPVTGDLLVACKGHPFLNDKGGKAFKTIYRFSMETMEIISEPFLLIELDTIHRYRNEKPMARTGNQIMAYLDQSKGDKIFQPSGIAIHPVTGELYVLGSVGKLLLVFSREGEMLAITDLPPSIFSQPEGICFSPDGILYIANEGGSGRGSISEFLPVHATFPHHRSVPSEADHQRHTHQDNSQ